MSDVPTTRKQAEELQRKLLAERTERGLGQTPQQAQEKLLARRQAEGDMQPVTRGAIRRAVLSKGEGKRAANA